MSRIYRVSALDSNYIWIIQPDSASKNVWILDPGEAEPVFEALNVHQLQPVALLITHHHKDHTGGIDNILEKYPVPVYGPASERIPQITHPLHDKDTFFIGALAVEVIATPGHTLDHLSYLVYPADAPAWLFCGDTLFGAGCGRLFEGTTAMGFASLQRLGQLPETTLIYCAHEYTRQNLLFARHVEPDNEEIVRRLHEVEQLLLNEEATLPSTLALEKQTNPFLRLSSPAIILQTEQYSGQKTTGENDVFSRLRQWKDHF